MSTRVLIIDTETTGIDPTKDSVIEVAAILYSLEHATVLEQFSSLIRAESNPAEAINRIPVGALDLAPNPEWVWTYVAKLAAQAGVVVAHNAEFDHAFMPQTPPLLRAMPWVCSNSDIQWPKQTAPKQSLVALALAHDLGVAYAHRALADCDLIARLFTRARELGGDLRAMLARAQRPKAEFVALVSYDDRQIAKDAGFNWHPEQKQWRRRMAIEDAAALPFRTRQVQAGNAS